MQFYIKILFVILILCEIPIIAQNFFPLNVGNQYQVKNGWWLAGPGGYYESGTDYYHFSVIEDSTIGESIFYRMSNTGYNGPFSDSCFFSYDSVDQKIYVRISGDDTTRLAVDFNSPAHSEYISYIRGVSNECVSGGLSWQVVLGDTHLVYSMQFQRVGPPGLERYKYSFSDLIGLSNYNFYVGNVSTAAEENHEVISAIVDSIAYKPIVLKIDSVYPLIDRPIDTFPFLLSIPYTSSYYRLIDSFYLSTELIRNDSTLLGNNYNISIYNPKLTLNFAGLEVGDIIKLKATITDTSIFNNIDYFPDSGWAIINVLSPILEVETENKYFKFHLEQNYPNPFNPSTKINYSIQEETLVKLQVYDILGKKIVTLVNDEQPAGSYNISFYSGKYSLPSGVYFYKLIAGDFIQTKKMILSK